MEIGALPAPVVAALVAGSVALWFAAASWAELRRRDANGRDLARALRAEIDAYREELRGVDFGAQSSEIEAQIRAGGDGPQRFVPFVRRERRDTVYRAFLGDLALLPSAAIAPVVRHYALLETISAITEDLTGEAARTASAEQQASIYRHYVEREARALENAEAAAAALAEGSDAFGRGRRYGERVALALGLRHDRAPPAAPSPPAEDLREKIGTTIAARFGSRRPIDLDPLDPAAIAASFRLLDRRACRRFRAEPVPYDLMRLVIATGLSAPSKSDLQQADILWVRDRALRAEITAGCGDWIANAPAETELLVILGNGRRLARLYPKSGFPNDHFDALFNTTGDAAILLGQLVSAATLAGLGACPISVIRNRAEEVSTALALPERVFPFAGLALGWPEDPRAAVLPRLGPDATIHIDRFDVDGQDAAVARYDARRGPVGGAPSWSEAKRVQYAQPQRTGWGAFLRAKGFRVD
ncbi:MAG: nitroreductase family protein [Paracoccaceae bacterium]